MDRHERPLRMGPEGKAPRNCRRNEARVRDNSASRGYLVRPLRIDDDVCLTATVDILKAIAKGSGPKHAILALGYAGWAPGQLETEIQDNGWLHCDADPDLIFGGDIEEKYIRALRKIGIDPGVLSNEAGHA